jgi:hypothetical protein
MPKESAIDRLLRLTRVVVPAHERKDPRSGKVEHVDTYTYQRRGGRQAITGTFRRLGAEATPTQRAAAPKASPTPTQRVAEATPSPAKKAPAKKAPAKKRAARRGTSKTTQRGVKVRTGQKKKTIPPEEKARIRAEIAKHPIDPQNIVDVWDQANPYELKSGRNWYPNAHKAAVALAKAWGVSIRQAAGMIAVYSPQKGIGHNLIEASEVLRTGRPIGGEGAHANYVPSPDDLHEIRVGVMATQNQRDRAAAILLGEDFEDVFAGPMRTTGRSAGTREPTALKIRAFAGLIARGGQDPHARLADVVVDRHAAGVARGMRFTEDDFSVEGPSDSLKKFTGYADAYREAARRLSEREGREVSPEEVQAVTWLARRRLNGDMDARRKKIQASDEADLLNYMASYEPTVADIIGNPETGYVLAKSTDVGRTRPPASGTVEDPIDVQGDVDKAVVYLAQGLHVRLNKPSEVAILTERMHAYIQEVKAKGEKTPDINLCNLTVPGTNLFCHEHKGIPRIKMPQLSGTPRPGSPAYEMRDDRGRVNVGPAFRASLVASGVGVTETTMPASHLKATQMELDGAKVASMVAKLRKLGAKAKDNPIFVSNDGYVLDGHHRWAANAVLDSDDNEFGNTEMTVIQVDMEIGKLLDYANWFADEAGIQQASMSSRPEDDGPPGSNVADPLQNKAANPLVNKVAASAVTDYWERVYGWNPCCGPSTAEWEAIDEWREDNPSLAALAAKLESFAGED